MKVRKEEFSLEKRTLEPDDKGLLTSVSSIRVFSILWRLEIKQGGKGKEKRSTTAEIDVEGRKGEGQTGSWARGRFR
jgi:hypothetical protein